MIKNNNLKLLISSILILCPILPGVILWNRLPDHMAVHWDSGGSADGWQSKAFAVFGLPLILMILHWLCVFFTDKDPKQQAQNRKALGMVLWIIPAISWFACGMTYGAAFGLTMNVLRFVPVLFGLLFMFIGNYLPKCKQNYTLGIKISWTLQDEETWNKTHRFTGKVWFIGGVLMLFTSLIPDAFASLYGILVFLVPMVIIPFVYAYSVYKKRRDAGLLSPADGAVSPNMKKAKIISLILVAVILVGVAILMCTGHVTVAYDDTSFTVDATYWQAVTIPYEEVVAVEYRQHNDPGGTRTYGFSSARLLLGNFESEMGSYLRYTYTGCKAHVSIVASNNRVLVINGADEAATKAIYDTLTQRTKK